MASLVDPLSVPADRPERVKKAVKLGTAAVIVDLDDAVTPARKALARLGFSDPESISTEGTAAP